MDDDDGRRVNADGKRRLLLKDGEKRKERKGAEK